ncbi:MAG TPA: response regulator transcription factor [Dehalococcoidia bacterium]|nr:response regulator transcription factor [Dehalococcoidia bacterium]
MTQAPVFLLVDDNTLLRASLAKLIGLWRSDAVIAEAADGREAVEMARQLRPDVILMDIRMPSMDGIEATRLIKADLPETKVIMLTVSEEEEDLFEAIGSGAHGYLLKDLRPDELFEKLEDALRGEAVIAAPMAQRILGAFVEQAHRRAKAGQGEVDLSPREKEVLELASRGAANKEIAEQLFISVGTVKNHIHNILDKLHLKNRAQIAAYGRMRRLMDWR